MNNLFLLLISKHYNKNENIKNKNSLLRLCDCIDMHIVKI